MNLKRGDHICSIYSSSHELTDTVSEFLADGLGRQQRCWYVASAEETAAVRARLEALGVDVQHAIERGALKFISGDGTHLIHGSFNAERANKVFNDAIEQAGADGFTGFRAAAEMSWALGRPDTVRRLIVYEALLRSLFANCRAIGLCMYDRRRMPLDVIDGALATHPKVRTVETYQDNPFFEASRTTLEDADPEMVMAKLRRLDATP
jgi:hypothetical protein